MNSAPPHIESLLAKAYDNEVLVNSLIQSLRGVGIPVDRLPKQGQIGAIALLGDYQRVKVISELPCDLAEVLVDLGLIGTASLDQIATPLLRVYVLVADLLHGIQSLYDTMTDADANCKPISDSILKISNKFTGMMGQLARVHFLIEENSITHMLIAPDDVFGLGRVLLAKAGDSGSFIIPVFNGSVTVRVIDTARTMYETRIAVMEA